MDFDFIKANTGLSINGKEVPTAHYIKVCEKSYASIVADESSYITADNLCTSWYHQTKQLRCNEYTSSHSKKMDCAQTILQGCQYVVQKHFFDEK